MRLGYVPGLDSLLCAASLRRKHHPLLEVGTLVASEVEAPENPIELLGGFSGIASSRLILAEPVGGLHARVAGGLLIVTYQPQTITGEYQ